MGQICEGDTQELEWAFQTFSVVLSALQRGMLSDQIQNDGFNGSEIQEELEKEAVPTIQPFTPVSPLGGEKRQSDSPLSSTPKRPTRTFQNREVDRVRWVQFHNSLLECNVIYKQPKYIYNSLLVCNVIYKQPKHI